MGSFSDTRKKRAALNIAVSFLSQPVLLVCGFIIPRLLIGKFGSDVYGATTSIFQFLSYITLLEGGIGGVARAAFYKPLSENNTLALSEIMQALKKFFFFVGIIFFVYVLSLAFTFKYISHIDFFSWQATFFLVLSISVSTFAQYFIGISNMILLQSAQKTYILLYLDIITAVINTIVTVLFVYSGAGIIAVKLASSFVFIIKPVFLALYVKKNYNLKKPDIKNKNLLPQKWTGLGQHLAYFLHNNTDVFLLTVMSSLKDVAVYSVYYLIVYHIQVIVQSFASGSEAVFGDMLAKKEYSSLNKAFSGYETLISVVTVVFFSVTAVLIVPFVKIYTSGITDANYIRPVFAVFLTLASTANCLRMPYLGVITAAGHFKQTRVGAYSEAVINIVLSVILLMLYGITGVAAATFFAVMFRWLYYVIYLKKNIMFMPILKPVKRFSVNAALMFIIVFVGNFALKFIKIDGYIAWVITGVILTLFAGVLTLAVNLIFYKETTLSIIKEHLKRN